MATLSSCACCCTAANAASTMMCWAQGERTRTHGEKVVLCEQTRGDGVLLACRGEVFVSFLRRVDVVVAQTLTAHGASMYCTLVAATSA